MKRVPNCQASSASACFGTAHSTTRTIGDSPGGEPDSASATWAARSAVSPGRHALPQSRGPILAQHLWILAGLSRRPPAHGIHPRGPRQTWRRWPRAATTPTSWRPKNSGPAAAGASVHGTRAGRRLAVLKWRYEPGNIFRAVMRPSKENVPESADPLSTFRGGSCGTGRARGRVCPRARARCAYRAAEGFRGAHILLLEVAENADRPAQGRQRPSRTCTDWPPFRCHRDHLIVVSSLTIRSCLLDRPPMRSGDVRAMEDGWISRAHPRLIPVTSGSTAGRAGMAHPAAAHAQPGVLITGGRGGAGEKHRGG